MTALPSYKVLLSTGSLPLLSLKEIFVLAKETGFDGCDLVIQRHLDHGAYKETLQECVAILPVYALHVPFERLKVWGKPVEALVRSVALAKEFDIPLVNFHPPSWFYLEFTFLRWFRKVKDFQRELRCEKVCVALENMPLTEGEIKRRPYLLNNFNDMIKFGVKRNLYFTFDTTHAATFEHGVIDAFLAYHKTGRLQHVHMSDHASERSHLLPGAGNLPLEELLRTMDAAGYDRTMSLEVAPHELPSMRGHLEAALREASSFLKGHGRAGRDGQQ
jgi:sugar phosphate isomerase/epimerase